MKNWIVSVLLVAVLLAGILGGLSFRKQYAALKDEQEAAVTAAQSELDALIAERNGVSPLDSSDEEQRIAAEQELLTQVQEEMERLSVENAQADTEIARLEQVLSEKQADEEYAYYKAAYDSMAEGRALVESYLEDH